LAEVAKPGLVPPAVQIRHFWDAGRLWNQIHRLATKSTAALGHILAGDSVPADSAGEFGERPHAREAREGIECAKALN